MTVTSEVDDFDILSAVWILACNDDNPIITYEGVKCRLDLPVDYNIRTLIAKRGELFRRGVPEVRLIEWKNELSTGLNLPTSIKVLKSEDDRQAAINAISVDDVFRSQFRATRYAEKSPIEIIDWGLRHIDRLRKAKIESKDVLAKQWQIWVAIIISLAGLILQLVRGK